MNDYLTTPDRRRGFCPIEEAGLGVPDTGPIVDLEQDVEPMPAAQSVRRFWGPIVGFTALAAAIVVFACTRG